MNFFPRFDSQPNTPSEIQVRNRAESFLKENPLNFQWQHLAVQLERKKREKTKYKIENDPELFPLFIMFAEDGDIGSTDDLTQKKCNIETLSLKLQSWSAQKEPKIKHKGKYTIYTYESRYSPNHHNSKTVRVALIPDHNSAPNSGGLTRQDILDDKLDFLEFLTSKKRPIQSINLNPIQKNTPDVVKLIPSVPVDISLRASPTEPNLPPPIEDITREKIQKESNRVLVNVEIDQKVPGREGDASDWITHRGERDKYFINFSERMNSTDFGSQYQTITEQIPQYQLKTKSLSGEKATLLFVFPFRTEINAKLKKIASAMSRIGDYQKEITIPNLDSIHPLLSASIGSSLPFIVHENADASAITEWLHDRIPQHKFNVISVAGKMNMSNPGLPSAETSASVALLPHINQQEIDSSQGDQMWGDILTDQSIVTVANLFELCTLKDSNLLTKYPYVNAPFSGEKSSGLAPYYSLLLMQLNYQLLSIAKTSNKIEPIQPSFNTCPAFSTSFFQFQFASPREVDLLELHGKLVPTETIGKISEKVSELLRKHKNETWDIASKLIPRQIAKLNLA